MAAHPTATPYGGKVNFDDGLFRVTELVHTEAYCGDESLDGTYMNALQSALAFESSLWAIAHFLR
ncbi:MAG: hypothetical protein R3C26_14130 [Calditrichia bacterium]